MRIITERVSFGALLCLLAMKTVAGVAAGGGVHTSNFVKNKKRAAESFSVRRLPALLAAATATTKNSVKELMKRRTEATTPEQQTINMDFVYRLETSDEDSTPENLKENFESDVLAHLEDLIGKSGANSDKIRIENIDSKYKGECLSLETTCLEYTATATLTHTTESSNTSVERAILELVSAFIDEFNEGNNVLLVTLVSPVFIGTPLVLQITGVPNRIMGTDELDTFIALLYDFISNEFLKDNLPITLDKVSTWFQAIEATIKSRRDRHRSYYLRHRRLSSPPPNEEVVYVNTIELYFKGRYDAPPYLKQFEEILKDIIDDPDGASLLRYSLADTGSAYFQNVQDITATKLSTWNSETDTPTRTSATDFTSASEDDDDIGFWVLIFFGVACFVLVVGVSFVAFRKLAARSRQQHFGEELKDDDGGDGDDDDDDNERASDLEDISHVSGSQHEGAFQKDSEGDTHEDCDLSYETHETASHTSD